MADQESQLSSTSAPGRVKGHTSVAKSETQILQLYIPNLMALVHKHMSQQLRAKVVSEDMVNSILASIIRLARGGKINIEASDSFMRLLVTIALNKVRKKARFFRAQKRNASREWNPVEDGITLEELIKDAGDPSDEDGVTVANLLEAVYEQLDEEERLVLAGRMDGRTNAEIAATLGTEGKSTKTVTRIANRIEALLFKLAEERDLI